MAIPIPLSALLPPSPASPLLTLSSPSNAILGPLPPTTPLHLALNYISLTDLPGYTHWSDQTTPQDDSYVYPDKVPAPVAAPGERVTVITGPRSEWQVDLEEEDEDWMREHGGGQSLITTLKRVDTRSCPTSDHLKLLLTLLSSSQPSSKQSKQDPTIALRDSPALIIMWDIAKLLMYQVEDDENMPPGEKVLPLRSGEWHFRPGVVLSDYMDIISAVRAATEHMSSLRQNAPPTQLVILEPHLDQFSSLPILGASGPGGKMSTPTREKRTKVKDGLEWILGGQAVATIEESKSETDKEDSTTYVLNLPAHPDEPCHLRRRHCPRGEYTIAQPDETVLIDWRGDRGGYRWAWYNHVDPRQ